MQFILGVRKGNTESTYFYIEGQIVRFDNGV